MFQRIPRLAAESEGREPRLHWAVDLFTLVTVVSAVFVGLFATDYFMQITMFGGVLACVIVWRYVSDTVVVAGCTTMVFGAVLGWGLDFYDRIWWYDDLAHFLFSFVGVMALARLVLHRFRADSALLLLTALWLSWLGIGSLWEIGEWLADRAQGTQHSRGYLDTMADMILNSAGAGIGAWMYWRWFRTPSDRLILQ